jgi:hypothetical protein
MSGGGDMQGTCCLTPDINKCPNYKADTVSCAINNKVCCFFREAGKKERKKKKRNTKDSHGGMKNIIIGRVVHGIN